MDYKERRKSVRVESQIPVVLSGREKEYFGETINLSMKGVYFSSEVFIEPLKKVKMGFMLPEDGKGDESPDTRQVEFDGVVVRTEPPKEDPDCNEYRVAVFITFLSKRSKKALSEYINDLL
ncbi:MAG TPA: PilZ domain-containing protein [Candidatus Krumholzibacteriaceae bacterium]|nr:PilZ domain-containing protein [Candidatus Krumholzibacteriaceae bacterium]